MIHLTIRGEVSSNIIYTLCIKCLQTSHMFCLFWINRTNDDDMTGVKSITKKALHHLAGHQLVSIQEAVHMVDDQSLVICSDRMTYVSINQGQVLRNDMETDKRKDIITVYRNRQKQFHDLSLEQYFYRVFSRNTFKQTKNDELNEDTD